MLSSFAANSDRGVGAVLSRGEFSESNDMTERYECRNDVTLSFTSGTPGDVKHGISNVLGDGVGAGEPSCSGSRNLVPCVADSHVW